MLTPLCPCPSFIHLNTKLQSINYIMNTIGNVTDILSIDLCANYLCNEHILFMHR